MRNRRVQCSESKARAATSASPESLWLMQKAQRVLLPEYAVGHTLPPGHLQPFEKKILPAARLAMHKANQLQG